MPQETMTNWERTITALKGGKPDRVPVVPIVSGYAGTHMGMSQGEFYRDHGTAVKALYDTYEDVGGWDALWPAAPMIMPVYYFLCKFPIQVKEPGVDLPDDYVLQTHEMEFLKYEDYDKIAEIGWDKFWFEDCIYRVTGWTPEKVKEEYERMNAVYPVLVDGLKRTQATTYFDFSTWLPFFELGIGRSMIPFTEDLYYRPEKVHKALRRMTDDLIVEATAKIKETGKKNILLTCERGSAYHYPLDLFEKFWMPYVKEVIDATHALDCVVTFHLDTNWSKNLPSFKKHLPKNSFCLELDGTTDMIAARDFMGDHCALNGDVPASLLSFGTTEEVEAYCKKLIREVGRNGGFVLGTGCECPIDCTRDNFLTMLNTCKNSFY